MNPARSSNKRRASQPTIAGIVAFGDPMTDETLVAAAKRGDEKAFDTLVRRHRPRILALVLRYTRVREDAEDVVQQALQKAFIYLNSFEGKSSFSTWITRIAINEALMWLRRARALREVSVDNLNSEDETAPAPEIADLSPDPEAEYLQREGMQILFAAIGELRPGMRTAIELRELGELSSRETARRMGLSPGSVKARIFQGRKKLRETLRRYWRSPRMFGRSALAIAGSPQG
jgi:RNA polymerase sigma-70 factor (ECF subfamily)